MNTEKKLSVAFNAPVIITFSILCFVAFILNIFTSGKTAVSLFSVYNSSFSSPLTYVRMFTHVLGHANWDHLFGNITIFLVIGPLLEEKYGSLNILFVIMATALVTGLVNFFFFPRLRLMGASGVVFALILLSSFTCTEEGKIPFTFILVAFIYIGQQVYSAIFINDNISNLTHLLGGVVGSVLGYIMNKDKKYNIPNY